MRECWYCGAAENEPPRIVDTVWEQVTNEGGVWWSKLCPECDPFALSRQEAEG